MSLSLSYKNVIVVFIILCSILFLLSPVQTEIAYGHYIFPVIRVLLIPFSWIPFPVLYIFIAMLLYGIYKLFTSKQKIMKRLAWVGYAAALFFFLFFLMWAYNYKRTDFARRFPITLPKIDSSSLAAEVKISSDGLIKSRPLKKMDYKPTEIEDIIRPSIRKYCAKFNYSAPGNVRVKTLPAGTLLRIKTAGFYLPYAGEAYVDRGLHSIQLPFTQAHEMCHGYGVTDEGACNFIAYLATINQSDSTVRYSGAMSYYRYVAGEYRYHFPRAYLQFRSQLPEEIQMDLDSINKQMIKYPDIFPAFRDKVYDKYLTLLNVPGGMSSYDKIIDYVREARSIGLVLKND
ncbi:MAG: DUF3810 family protein [Saprospiraceae bacterium]